MTLNERGYFAIYREGRPNRCPGCGRSQWYVGRTMAECAFCGTALPLESSASRPISNRKATDEGTNGSPAC